MSEDASADEATDTAGFSIAEASPHEAELARLAALEPVSYDQSRQAAADKLGIRLSTLDDEVQKRRPAAEAATGRGVSLPTVEPWPQPVTGTYVLDALAKAIRRHVILSLAAADAVALWVAHTWVAGRFQHTPRLGITSPAKRCGKSTLLDVLRATCHRPLKADNISASGVFRTVEALAPLTLLLDEADSFLRDNEELRGVLNSGFERSGEVIRVVEVRDEHQPIRFRTFAPLALAGIGALPSTLEDRAIPIVLRRKGAGETAVKLREPGARAEMADVGRKLARWAADRGPALNLNPAIPGALGDREGDIAVPLLAIADDAGGAWPGRARTALLELFGNRAKEDGGGDAGTLLLADLRGLFVEKGASRLASADIAEALGKMEERPWPEWRQGKPITPPQLARLVAPYGVRPINMRTNGSDNRVVKGYTADSFDDAWARYLPSVTTAPVENGVPSRYAATPLKPNGNPAAQTATAYSSVAADADNLSLPNQSCSGVAVAKGGAGVEPGHAAEWSAIL